MSVTVDIVSAAEVASSVTHTPDGRGGGGGGGGGEEEVGRVVPVGANQSDAAATTAALATTRENRVPRMQAGPIESPTTASAVTPNPAAAAAAAAALLCGPCDAVADGLIILLRGPLLSCLSVPDQLQLKQTCRFLHAEIARRVDVRPTSVVLVSPVVEKLLALNDTLMDEFYSRRENNQTDEEEEEEEEDEDDAWDAMREAEYPGITQLLERVLRTPITNDSGHGVVRTQSPLLPERERLHLMALIDRLAASQAEPDFHPGSNGVVLDIVHPALFCYVEGDSQFVPSELLRETPTQQKARLLDPAPPPPQEVDEDEFAGVVGDEISRLEEGVRQEPQTAETSSGMVTRVLRWGMRSLGLGGGGGAAAQQQQTEQQQHPSKREKLLLEDMWGRPFEDSTYQWLPTYFDVASDGVTRIEDYINGIPRGENGELYAGLAKLFSRALPLLEQAWTYCKTARFMSQRLEGIAFDHDDPTGPFYWSDFKASAENVVHDQFTPLRGRRLQVITKIVDYCLQPGESYEGAWHVEGMSHENIVATSVYVIDRSPQLQGGELRFKRAFSADEAAFIGYNVAQDRVGHFDRVIEGGLLPIGSMLTPHNHLVVFPNSHVHKVARLSNEGSQPARRRIVVFFLVNPERRIVSTKEVPNQRAGHPPAMSLAQAKAHRLELMRERKHHKQDFNVREIELCEH